MGKCVRGGDRRTLTMVGLIPLVVPQPQILVPTCASDDFTIYLKIFPVNFIERALIIRTLFQALRA